MEYSIRENCVIFYIPFDFLPWSNFTNSTDINGVAQQTKGEIIQLKEKYNAWHYNSLVIDILTRNNLMSYLFQSNKRIFSQEENLYRSICIICILFDSISTFFFSFIFLVKEMGRFSIPPSIVIRHGIYTKIFKWAIFFVCVWFIWRDLVHQKIGIWFFCFLFFALPSSSQRRRAREFQVCD
jgi:hypothetical protein